MSSYFALIWKLMLALMVVGYLIQVMVYRRLRTRHRELWHDLGRPNFMNHFRPASLRSVGPLYWKSRYKEVDDALLSAFAVAVKVIVVVLLLLLILAALLIGILRLGRFSA